MGAVISRTCCNDAWQLSTSRQTAGCHSHIRTGLLARMTSRVGYTKAHFDTDFHLITNLDRRFLCPMWDTLHAASFSEVRWHFPGTSFRGSLPWLASVCELCGCDAWQGQGVWHACSPPTTASLSQPPPSCRSAAILLDCLRGPMSASFWARVQCSGQMRENRM